MTNASPAPRDLSRRGQWCLVLGSSLIVLFAAVFVAGFVGLVLRIEPGWWVLVPAIGIQTWFSTVAWRRAGTARPVQMVMITLVVGWLIIGATGALSQLVTDTSVDGRHYQSETTLAVAHGWNPERDGPLFPKDTPYQPDATPKAPAIVGATVLRITDDIDTTRLFGATLLIAAALIAIAGLEAAGANRWLAVAGGLTLALNPVALAQLGTAMVDGVVSSVLLATLILALLWVWRHPPIIVLPPLAGALALLVNTKFTGLVYVGLIVLPVIFVAGLVARSGRRLAWMLGGVILCGLVAMLGLGYNPYLTNFLRYDHPLHPIYGPRSLDIGAQYRTGELNNVSEPERLALSVFGKSTAGSEDPKIKVPLMFDSDEWSSFRSPSVRIGGFGPLFSGGLVIALAALLAALIARLVRKRRVGLERISHQAYALLGAAAICLLATVVQPSAFLARFAPQLWFVPGFIAAAALLFTGTRVVKAIAWLALGILLVDAAGVGVATAVWDVRDTDREQASLARLRALSPLEAQFSSWRRSEARRLRDNGIRFRTMHQVQCKVPFVLSVSGGLSRRPQLYGVPAPPGAVQLCSIYQQPPPP
jgi:4-amino-4-deoxy-L-arabinose transferase-like glycosyltransferase